jgi:hypothetical protein
MKRDWREIGLGLVKGAVLLFLLWAFLIVACVAGVLVAIFVYDQHPVAAILGGIVAYFVAKVAFVVWMEFPWWNAPLWGGKGPPATVEEAARRNRGTSVRFVLGMIIVVGFFLYLISH